MDGQPRASAARQRRQWPVFAAAGLLVAGVTTGAPPEQAVPDLRDVPSVRTPSDNPDLTGFPRVTAAMASVTTRVTPGRTIVWPAPVAGVIPGLAFAAYQRAAESQPGCHLPLSLLAAIGKVESGHARGGQLDAAGTTVFPILGPTLDGSPGLAAIADTDDGAFDGDARWDRAVGPMQFIPGTWRRWATDGNDDGTANPHNVFDAAGAAGRYLCANGRDLATEDGLDAAILSYNNSPSYLRIVRTWMMAYENGSAVPVDWTPPADQPAAPPPDRPDGEVVTPPPPPTPPPAGEPPPPTAPPTEPPTEPPTAPPTVPPTLPPVLPPETPVTAPVTGLVCTVGGLVTGIGGLLGGLLGGAAPDEPDDDC